MDWKARGESPDAWHMTDDLRAEHGKGDPFAAAIRATRMAMLITNPRQKDNPTVFANDAFLRLTGYERCDIIGRNCRFLQGEKTDPDAVSALRAAIAQRTDINIDILNYRKDGSSFWNALYISPVENEKGELQFFFASLLDVSDRKKAELAVSEEKLRVQRAVEARTAELRAALEAKTTLLHEVDHRVKNNLQMISSLIVMQSRTIADEEIRNSLQSMLTRVEALSTVHRRLYQSDDVSRFNLAEFIEDLVTDLVAASAYPHARIIFDLQHVSVGAARAAPIALIVNELVTNALKHAFHATKEPCIEACLKLGEADCKIAITDNGSGMVPSEGPPTFGTKLIRSLSRQLNATVTWHEGEPGTRVALQLPRDDLVAGEDA